MPLDQSIYQRLGQQNTLGQLAGSINQYTENQGRLADLARQRQMQDVQMQRQEQQWQAQQSATAQANKEKSIQKSSLELANMIRSGAPRDQVESWAVQRYSELGLPTDQLKQKLDGVYAAPAGVTGQADLMEESAFPEIAAKQRMEQRFATQKQQTPSALATLMAEREKIASQNPNAPQLAIYDQMIQKQTTHTPFMQVATGEGGEQSLITAPKAGGKATVQQLGIVKPTKDAQLSPQAQKELFEADENIQTGIGVQNTLRQALNLNKDAYSGYGALTRAKLASNMPGQVDPKADATIQLDNLVREQALAGLKIVFGGNPTEGERAMLLDLQASSEKTPQQREAILNNALKSIERKQKFNEQKAESLRGGTYFKQAPSQPAQIQPADSEAVAWAKANPADPRSAKILQLQR